MSGIYCTWRNKKHIQSICVGKCGEKRQFGRPGNRWEGDIKMHLKIEGEGWIHLTQDWFQWLSSALS